MKNNEVMNLSSIYSNTEKPFVEEEVEVKHTESKSLVLYNDDVNTFEYVIDSLVQVCEHTFEQAEQCTYLVHYKGKCDVKSGDDTELKPMKEALLERGLTATIE